MLISVYCVFFFFNSSELMYIVCMNWFVLFLKNEVFLWIEFWLLKLINIRILYENIVYLLGLGLNMIEVFLIYLNENR